MARNHGSADASSARPRRRGWHGVASWVAPVLLLATACGARTAQESAAPRPGVPTTDRDPLPYTPPASDQAIAGETVALSAAGGEDQARQILPALLRAVQHANERELEGLFGDEIGYVAGRRAAQAGRQRAGFVQRLMAYAQRSILPGDQEVSELLDLETLTVVRASTFFRDRELPRAVRVTDLVVVVSVLEPGRMPLRTLFGWSGRAHLVVRPGRDARIVAM